MSETVVNLLLTLAALAVFGSLALSIYGAIEIRRQGRVLGAAVTAIRQAVAVVAEGKAQLVPTVNRLRSIETAEDIAPPRAPSNGKKPASLRGLTEDEEWSVWAVKHPEEVDPEDLKDARKIHADLLATREV